MTRQEKKDRAMMPYFILMAIGILMPCIQLILLAIPSIRLTNTLSVVFIVSITITSSFFAFAIYACRKIEKRYN